MTSNAEWQGAETIARRMLGDILWSVPDTGVGRQASDLRTACGDLSENVRVQISEGTFSSNLINCFDIARASGATLPGTDRVRRNLLAVPIEELLPVAVTQLGVFYCLSSMSQILAATTFVSREDVETALVLMENAFNVSQDAAADESDIATYLSIVSLHSAVSRDLAERARPLPQIVTYSFERRLPSLFISQRTYYVGDRGDELEQENKVVHPLFMPNEGLALSS